MNDFSETLTVHGQHFYIAGKSYQKSMDSIKVKEIVKDGLGWNIVLLGDEGYLRSDQYGISGPYKNS